MIIDVWSKDACPNCEQAKKLLVDSSIEYTEKKIGYGYSRDDLLAIVPNAKSVPQIIIDGSPIGGLPELKALLLQKNTV